MNQPFGFYGIITEPLRGYEYLCKLLVDHEIRYIQLRMKKETIREVYKIAELFRKITDGTTSKFIVNDYVQVAVDVYADGVHIGQDDEPAEKVMEKIRLGMEIGISTHNPTQTEDACKLSPSYIGIGPVYKTPTKVIADPELGLAGMKQMIDYATVPSVVLGAVDSKNLRAVLEAGARNFASVRPINQTDKPATALKTLIAIWRDTVNL
jgi:thiamine-phosphate pyrophosphorylase